MQLANSKWLKLRSVFDYITSTSRSRALPQAIDTPLSWDRFADGETGVKHLQARSSAVEKSIIDAQIGVG
jgi:hypothetical protein